MAQAATRQMSAVREQHAEHPRRPRPATKPGEPSSASPAARPGAAPEGGTASGDEGSGRGAGGGPASRRKPGSGGGSAPGHGGGPASRRKPGSGGGSGAEGGGGLRRSLSIPEGLSLPGLEGVSLPSPHLSIWTRLVGKLIKRLAKRELRKLARAAQRTLENAEPDGVRGPREGMKRPLAAARRPLEAIPNPGEAVDMGLEGLGQMGAGALQKLTSAVPGAGDSLLSEVRPGLPIQQAVDVAVPLDFAWRKWMELSFLPEGVDRVVDIEREDGELRGRVEGRADTGWSAEILDERAGESFAWKSVEGSDCAGLVTFHRLSERLTRIELTLDVVPQGAAEVVSLVTRLAHRRALRELRKLKADLEVVSPDVYADDENSSSQ